MAKPRCPGCRLDLDAVVAGLRSVRECWRESQNRLLKPGGRELPSRESLAMIIEGRRGALLPPPVARATC